MSKYDTNHHGKNILDVMKQDQVKKYKAGKDKLEKADKAYQKLKEELDALIATGKPLD